MLEQALSEWEEYSDDLMNRMYQEGYVMLVRLYDEEDREVKSKSEKTKEGEINDEINSQQLILSMTIPYVIPDSPQRVLQDDVMGIGKNDEMNRYTTSEINSEITRDMSYNINNSTNIISHTNSEIITTTINSEIQDFSFSPQRGLGQWSPPRNIASSVMAQLTT